MIIGRVGKVRSFKISPRVLFWVVVFLLLYVPASVFVVNRWMDLQRKAEVQQVRIDQLELDLARAERDLFKFQQHVALLESYITSMETEERETEVRTSEVRTSEARTSEARTSGGTRPQAQVEAPVAVPDPEPQSMENQPSPAPAEEAKEPERAKPIPGFVDIERMAIERDGEAVQVAFNLVNVTDGEEPVSGYVHILAEGNQDGPPWWEVYPRGEVAEGFPANYRVGQPFIIQRFKPIEGRFDPRAGRGVPDNIRVVVYDDAGRLICDEAFEVENAS